MYRALALKAIENDVDLDSERDLMELVSNTRIALEPMMDGNRVLLDGVSVSQRVREPAVTVAASRVSVHGQVRTWMVDQQRLLGSAGGVVMEGRDIGTVVFPDAEVKIFLDAAPEVRGARRFRQGAPVTERETQADIIRELGERDQRDRNRTESPLHPAADAEILDSTEMTLEQVLQKAERLVKERTGAPLQY